jgi:hypothetical protein
MDPRDDPKAFMKTMVLDSLGPYSLSMAVFTAAIHQGTHNPPEWPLGAVGLSERFASNMGVTLVGNTTRYGLAGMLRQDTLYYRCRCDAPWARVRHAAFSALVARRVSDGSSIFSVADLAAPYAATFTAVYVWYPRRYGAEDAFRMGNYNLLGTVGTNLVFEFMPVKVRKMLAHVHLSSQRIAN